jgi:hypothetical protein
MCHTVWSVHKSSLLSLQACCRFTMSRVPHHHRMSAMTGGNVLLHRALGPTTGMGATGGNGYSSHIEAVMVAHTPSLMKAPVGVGDPVGRLPPILVKLCMRDIAAANPAREQQGPAAHTRLAAEWCKTSLTHSLKPILINIWASPCPDQIPKLWGMQGSPSWRWDQTASYSAHNGGERHHRSKP